MKNLHWNVNFSISDSSMGNLIKEHSALSSSYMMLHLLMQLLNLYYKVIHRVHRTLISKFLTQSTVPTIVHGIHRICQCSLTRICSLLRLSENVFSFFKVQTANLTQNYWKNLYFGRTHYRRWQNSKIKLHENIHCNFSLYIKWGKSVWDQNAKKRKKKR